MPSRPEFWQSACGVRRPPASRARRRNRRPVPPPSSSVFRASIRTRPAGLLNRLPQVQRSGGGLQLPPHQFEAWHQHGRVLDQNVLKRASVRVPLASFNCMRGLCFLVHFPDSEIVRHCHLPSAAARRLWPCPRPAARRAEFTPPFGTHSRTPADTARRAAETPGSVMKCHDPHAAGAWTMVVSGMIPAVVDRNRWRLPPSSPRPERSGEPGPGAKGATLRGGPGSTLARRPGRRKRVSVLTHSSRHEVVVSGGGFRYSVGFRRLRVFAWGFLSSRLRSVVPAAAGPAAAEP